MMDALIPKTFEQSLGLEECLHFYPLRKNRSVRFDFSGSTVLLASRGHSVSFNTTVGGDVLLKDKLCSNKLVNVLELSAMACHLGIPSNQ